MNFKPGDKVWIENAGGMFSPGTYAGVLIRPDDKYFLAGWWEVDIEGVPLPMVLAHEISMRRRDDPPPQQEPKREATGEWDLCPWRPASVPKEVV